MSRYLLPGAAQCSEHRIGPVHAGTARLVSNLDERIEGEVLRDPESEQRIVANDAARGDALINMKPRDDAPVGIPGVLVGYSTGEAMKANPGKQVDAALTSASIEGTANAEQTEVTWALTDYSQDNNQNVTMTIMDNPALSPDTPVGQAARNPTKEGYGKRGTM